MPPTRNIISSDPTRTYTVCGSPFIVSTRYTLLKPIGQGAHGIVCSARDNATGEVVAIKKISRVYSNEVEGKRTVREIQLLRCLDHDNIIQIKTILKPTSEDYTDVYIVFELMDTDLHQLTISEQPLSDDHCRYFVYQLLRGLKYIHSAGVIHRDVKPGNLLLNEDCDLKIADFGLARTTLHETSTDLFMTEYVATRWYRAPEIMLSWQEYTQTVDVWSAGCVMAELLGRKPLFPGRDYIQQIDLILNVLGSPSQEDTERILSSRARSYVRGLPPRPPIALGRIFPSANPVGLDLLAKLLVFEPSKRISVDDALHHPYFESLHDPEDEPVADARFRFPSEDKLLNGQEIRELVEQEMLLFAEQEQQRLAAHGINWPNTAAAAADARGGGGGGRQEQAQISEAKYSSTASPGGGGGQADTLEMGGGELGWNEGGGGEGGLETELLLLDGGVGEIRDGMSFGAGGEEGSFGMELDEDADL